MGNIVELIEQAHIAQKKREQKKNFVCHKCVDDYALKEFIKKESTKKRCDFCQSTCKSTDSFKLLKLIHDSLEYFYTQNLYDEGLHWDTKKGQWANDDVYTTSELIRDVISDYITDNEDLLKYIIDSFEDDSGWCRVNYLSLPENAGLRLSWDSFEKIVKHKIRYSFLNTSDPINESDRYDHIIPSNEMLRELEYKINDLNLVKILKKNLVLYRCRSCDKNEFPYTVEELGLPPVKKASQNRMSPLGIPMLYVSDSPETALQEVQSFTALS